MSFMRMLRVFNAWATSCCANLRTRLSTQLHTMRLSQKCMRTIEFCIDRWSRIWRLWMMSRLLYKITRKISSEVSFSFHDYSIDTRLISFTTLFSTRRERCSFFQKKKTVMNLAQEYFRAHFQAHSRVHSWFLSILVMTIHKYLNLR